MVGIVTITFLLTNAIPGDPVRIMLGPSPSAQLVEQVQARYGLDQPLYLRYWRYVTGVARGDLGHSIHFGRPVSSVILQRLPVTLLLMVSAFAFAIATAVPLGVVSAKRRNKPTDHVSRVVALIGVSTPSFWIGLLLIIVFAYQLNVFPSSGMVLPWADPTDVRGATNRVGVLLLSAYHLVLPMIALGTLQMAAITRIERSSMVESLHAEYVTLARAYGVSERTIMRKHAFRVAQLPVITIIGLQLSSILGGAVLIETVFNINGMGRLIIQAIQANDYQLVMGTTLVFGLSFLVGVILTDISYAYIDPRVSYGDR
jgi:peptide/nickel transport system permease protein